MDIDGQGEGRVGRGGWGEGRVDSDGQGEGRVAEAAVDSRPSG